MARTPKSKANTKGTFSSSSAKGLCHCKRGIHGAAAKKNQAVAKHRKAASAARIRAAQLKQVCKC